MLGLMTNKQRRPFLLAITVAVLVAGVAVLWS